VLKFKFNTFGAKKLNLHSSAYRILIFVTEYWAVGNFERIGTVFKGRYDLMGCDAVFFDSISNNTASRNRRTKFSYYL
jgi:hypothetical protein